MLLLHPNFNYLRYEAPLWTFTYYHINWSPNNNNNNNSKDGHFRKYGELSAITFWRLHARAPLRVSAAVNSSLDGIFVVVFVFFLPFEAVFPLSVLIRLKKRRRSFLIEFSFRAIWFLSADSRYGRRNRRPSATVICLLCSMKIDMVRSINDRRIRCSLFNSAERPNSSLFYLK